MKKTVLRMTIMYSTSMMVRIDLLSFRLSEEARIMKMTVAWKIVTENMIMHTRRITNVLKVMKMKSPKKLSMFRTIRMLNR